jgi:hypothetical protein
MRFLTDFMITRWKLFLRFNYDKFKIDNKSLTYNPFKKFATFNEDAPTYTDIYLCWKIINDI